MSATLVGAVRGIFAVAVIEDDATIDINRGFSEIEHTGTGIFTFLLQNGVSIKDTATILCQCYGPGGGAGFHGIAIQNSADFASGQFEIRVYANGTLADPDFMSVQVQDVAPN